MQWRLSVKAALEGLIAHCKLQSLRHLKTASCPSVLSSSFPSPPSHRDAQDHVQWLLQHGKFKAALEDAQITAVAVAEREGEGEAEEASKKASEMLLQVGEEDGRDGG